MQPITLQKYQTRARNFYRKHCGSDTPSSADICAALLSNASDYRPNSFSTLKSALAHDQAHKGNISAAKSIKTVINPVTAPNSQMTKKPKIKQIKKAPFEDFRALHHHLRAGGHLDEAAALILAYCLGVRPCEMRTITVTDNTAHIIGGKKSAKLNRGADRSLEIRKTQILKLVKWAAQWMAYCPRTNTAIRDCLRKECRRLWPRRKHHPTLKSFRHQIGSNLKASGESAESIAYIMGHQSTESSSAYGDRRAGAGKKLHVRPAKGVQLENIRNPRELEQHSVEKTLDTVALTTAIQGNWFKDMKRKRDASALTALSPAP